MDPQPGASTNERVYRLRTFGAPALLGESGEPVITEQVQHRRRIALLAVLAAAGERGRSRDQLLLLFWPDSSQSKARHSLEQLVYSIRRSIAEDVFRGVNPLRINPERVVSDIAEFTDALAHEDFEGAVAAYSGVFLDGFYLSEAPEFEQWMHAERSRLAQVYSSALQELAERADRSGNHASAVRWWRMLAESDPVSSAAALGLVRALMVSGDHVSALRHADQYERTVRSELGTSAGPAVAALTAEIRARANAPTTHPTAFPTSPESFSSAAGFPAGPEAAPPGAASFDEATDRGSPETAKASATEKRSRSLPGFAVLAIGAVVVAIVAVSAALAKREPGNPPLAAVLPEAKTSIAVLPFSNVSGLPEDASIVDGITEELTGVLSRIDQLRVVARTSAFVFKNSTLDVRRIADSLHVTHVLEGAVQRSNERIRVQVRLIDARDGATRWAESYDRGLQDILAVQSDIAGAVARELDLRLAGRAAASVRRASTQNPAAYELYLRGRDPVHFRTPDGRKTGLAYLERAVALDSNFAAAYANMAYMYLGLDSPRPNTKTEFGLANPGVAGRMRWAAEKAIALDPNLPEAYAALGISHVNNADLRNAEIAFKKALSLPGYSRAREHLARLYLHMGRPAEALSENLRAVEEDPLSPTAIADLGYALCLNGRVQEGMAQLARIADLRPPLRRTSGFAMLCEMMSGSWRSVIDSARADPPELRRSAWYLGYSFARSGQTDSARMLRSQLIERWSKEPGDAFSIALISAGLRDHANAFVWLDRSFQDGSFSYDIMLPVFSELHGDPRFERIRRRIGIQKR